jgi:alpha-tubulin suppressor-like RCC1 family protein
MASAGVTQTDIQSISIGSGFTCAVVADSTYTRVAKCWGTDSYGELGIGCTGSACNAKYPSTVVVNTTSRTPLSVVSSVSAGSLHACAVLTSGATYCWGYNAYGQLGNGSTTDSNLPQLVYDDASAAIIATDVSAGGFSTCALVNSSVPSVRCWGYNYFGQLGNGSKGMQETRAVSVTLPNDPIQNPVIQISNGYRDACAVLKSGDIYCWGGGSSGQLGQDPNASSSLNDCYSGDSLYCSSTPILVNSLNILKPNVKVSCGNQFMMAWNDSGSVYGLGLDYAYGQLGNGSTISTFTPVPISSSWH